MKTVVLGDIHGRIIWKQILEKENPQRVIFLGDYFDSRDGITGEQQINNFLDILEYKKSHKDIEVILLVGNHDFHYLELGIMYRGFQAGTAVAIHQILTDNLKDLQIAYFLGIPEHNILFTHAGVTETFLKDLGWAEESICGYLNDLFHFRRQTFQVMPGDKYGDDIYQSCIWVRPKSLVSDSNLGLTQIVGHTTQNEITYISNKKNSYYFIDTLGISGQYLIINDKITIGNGKENIPTTTEVHPDGSNPDLANHG